MKNPVISGSHKTAGPFLTFLLCFYIFFCYFEPYINSVIGSGGKYIIFLVIICFLFSYRTIKIEWYHLSILLWFLLKLASVLWVSDNYIVRLHFFSQVGMVLLFLVMTMVSFDERLLKSVIDTSLYASGLVGFLSLFYSSAYQSDRFSVRQVLTVFGAQNDPNDQAAFLLAGIAVAFYYLLDGKEKKKAFSLFLIAVIFINAFAVFKTGSRAGLLAFVLLGICAAVLSRKKRKGVSLRRIGNFAAILAFFSLLFALAKRYLQADTFERIFMISTYGGGSGRIEKWSNALEIFLEHPVFGGGWGSYWGYNNFYVVVHNTLISVLADGGMIGFLLLFLPVFYVLAVSFRKGAVLPFLVLTASLAPSLFIDAINKRFFWNAIIIAFMLINGSRYPGEQAVQEREDYKSL